MKSRFSATIAVLGFNQEDTIEEAIRSALEQDFPDLEVLLSDDCSVDSTFQIMLSARERYQGPHTVRVFQNLRNLGTSGHINRIVQLSSHNLIILNAGDDISMRNRVSIIAGAYLATAPPPLLLHSQAIAVYRGLDRGVLSPNLKPNPSLKELVLKKNFYLGCTGALTKEAHCIFGPLLDGRAAEDTIEGFRAALLGRATYVSLPLVRYRLGDGASSSTNRYSIHGLSQTFRLEEAAARSRLATLEQRRIDVEAMVGRLSTNDLEKISKVLDIEIRKQLQRLAGHRVLSQKFTSTPGERIRLNDALSAIASSATVCGIWMKRLAVFLLMRLNSRDIR